MPGSTAHDANASPLGEAFVVSFRRPKLVVCALRPMFGAILGGILVALPSRALMSDALEVAIVWFIALAGGLMFLVSVASLKKLLIWSMRPAIVSNSEGMTIGFMASRPLRLPWSEISDWGFKDGNLDPDGDRRFIVLTTRPKRVNRRVALSDRLRSVALRQPLLSIEADLLDGSWETIDRQIRLDDMQVRSNHEWMSSERVADSVDYSVALDRNTALVSVEDYENVFRNSPSGLWSTAMYSFAPGDCSVLLGKDGRGNVYTTGGSFFGEDLPFLWRPLGPFQIEILAPGIDSEWVAIEYLFTVEDGEVSITFNERDFLEQSGDTTLHLTTGVLRYSGPC